MGVINWLLGRGPDETRTTDINLLDRLDGWTGGRESSAGIVVSELTALQVAGVLACVSRVSLDVATTPINIKRQKNGATELMNHMRVAKLLRSRPNPKHTAHQFIGMMTAQSMLYGESAAWILWGVDGQPLELWPLKRNEWSCMSRGFEDDYQVNAYEGAVSGRYTKRDILHLRPQSMDGKTGLDRLLYARNSIGLASAALDTQARTYKNGNRMPGYWTTEQVYPEGVADRLAERLYRAIAGGNQWKSPLLDGGLNYKTAGQTFHEGQLIETRKHELIEACAAFGVLPAVLGVDDKTQAFASVEAMFSAHLKQTLRPQFVAWEQTIDRDLMDGSGPLFAKHDTSDIEKATTKERSESYRTLTETLILTPNEAREREGLERIPGLDELWIELQRGKAGLDKGQTQEQNDET